MFFCTQPSTLLSNLLLSGSSTSPLNCLLLVFPWWGCQTLLLNSSSYDSLTRWCNEESLLPSFTTIILPVCLLLRLPWHCNPSVLLLHILQWDESSQGGYWLTNRWQRTRQVGVFVCWISWESQCWHSCADVREVHASLNGTEATPWRRLIVRRRDNVCRIRKFSNKYNEEKFLFGEDSLKSPANVGWWNKRLS